MKLKDLTGKRFGKLVMLRRHGNHPKNKRVTWECQCDCGNKTIVCGSDLKSGNTTSCGCQSSRNNVQNINKTHGMSKTPLYYVWCAMKNRCYNKNQKKL